MDALVERSALWVLDIIRLDVGFSVLSATVPVAKNQAKQKFSDRAVATKTPLSRTSCVENTRGTEIARNTFFVKIYRCDCWLQMFFSKKKHKVFGFT